MPVHRPPPAISGMTLRTLLLEEDSPLPLAELARLGYRVQFLALPNDAASTWAVEATHPGSALRYVATGRTLQEASADLIRQIKTATEPARPLLHTEPSRSAGYSAAPPGSCALPSPGG